MRIGLVGGSFNPVHNGHLRVAIEVKEQMELDWVEIIPAPRPPHKLDKKMVSFEMRVMLLKKSIQDIDFLKINTIEGDRDGPSYTVWTLRELKMIYSKSDLFFVVGGDEIKGLDKWYKWRELFSLANLVVVGRKEKDLFDLEHFLDKKLPEAKRYLDYSWRIEGNRIDYINIPRIEVSSSMIRKKALFGKSLRGLVPEVIEQDIYKLYCKKHI